MLRTRLLGCVIAIDALAAPAVASAQTWHTRPGEILALGACDASVNYDNTRSASHLVGILAERPGSTPIRLSADLKLGQALRISICGPAHNPATAVRPVHTHMASTSPIRPRPSTDERAIRFTPRRRMSTARA